MNEWFVGIATGVIVFLITAPMAWLVSSWRTQRNADKRQSARRSAAQWTLEHVSGEEWTLTRDSVLTAFALHVWEEGDSQSAGRVGFGEYRPRNDIQSGETVKITGVRPGAEIQMDWVEGSERLAAVVTVREGVRRASVKREDTRRFF